MDENSRQTFFAAACYGLWPALEMGQGVLRHYGMQNFVRFLCAIQIMQRVNCRRFSASPSQRSRDADTIKIGTRTSCRGVFKLHRSVLARYVGREWEKCGLNTDIRRSLNKVIDAGKAWPS